MTYLYERRLGTRRIMGTDHPVDVVVYKAGKDTWLSAVLCNGIAEGVREFATRSGAIRHAEVRDAVPTEGIAV